VDAPETDPAATLDDLLTGRWSCRAFLPEPVPRETVEAILVSAGRSASWCNTQPWHVHVVEGDATDRFREGLAQALAADPVERPDLPFPTSYDGVLRERRRDSARQLYESVGITWGDREASFVQTLRNFELFGAPQLALVTTPRALGTYGAVDCGLFLQAFTLAARARGVATIMQAALAGASPYVREFLDLPDDRAVLAGISFGYADEADPVNGYRTPRQPLADLATFVGRGPEDVT